MDPLTHVFLPLTVAYVLVRDLLPSPRYLLLGLFGLVPDLDKLLGVPGLLHSLLTVVPLCAGLVVVDRWWRGDAAYGTLLAAFLLSHLLLDFVDGSGLYALYPLTDAGLGLSYPLTVTFGDGLLGFQFERWPVVLSVESAPTGYAESPSVDRNTFGFLAGYGVASVLTFSIIYAGERYREQWGSPEADT